MSRPLRIEFPGAIYHVTSRGDRREPIFDDDADRQMFLETVGAALERFDAYALAYCLMDNHYHLVLHKQQATAPGLRTEPVLSQMKPREKIPRRLDSRVTFRL